MVGINKVGFLGGVVFQIEEVGNPAVINDGLVAFIADGATGVGFDGTNTFGIEYCGAVAHAEDELARVFGRFVMDKAGEGSAVDLVIGRYSCAGDFEEGGEEVCEIDEGIGMGFGFDTTGGVDNEGHACAVFTDGGFAAADDAAVEFAVDAFGGPVVGGEDGDGVFGEAEVVNGLEEATDKNIGVFDHGDLAWVFAGCFRFSGCVDKGTVGEDHGEVEEKGFFLIALHEVDEEAGVDIGTEHTGMGSGFAVGVDVWIPVALCAGGDACFVSGPHTPFVEAVLFHEIGLDAKVVDLPFARGGSGVAGLLEEPGKGKVVFGIEMAPGSPARNVPVVDPAVVEGIATGEERDARGCALGHGVDVVAGEAGGGEFVDGGGLDSFGAIRTDPFLAEVIDHDEDDVWLGCGSGAGGGQAIKTTE